jgi:hypothetical protein
MAMILTKDNMKLGMVMGLVGPVLGLLIIYLVKYSSVSFGVFFDEFIHTNKLLTSIGSLSLLANAILFTVYLNMHKDSTAKGIFIVTLVYGMGILLLKVFN